MCCTLQVPKRFPSAARESKVEPGLRRGWPSRGAAPVLLRRVGREASPVRLRLVDREVAPVVLRRVVREAAP
eukprot:8172597-Alexandrium_andersonii.AAC.1